MKVRNQSLLQRPWLFPIYTVLGVPLGLYLSGGAVKVLGNATVILIGVGCVAALNAWFFISLRQTLRDQNRVPGETPGRTKDLVR
jgi:hypothetical protein